MAGFLCEIFAHRRTDGGPKQDCDIIVVAALGVVWQGYLDGIDAQEYEQEKDKLIAVIQ